MYSYIYDIAKDIYYNLCQHALSAMTIGIIVGVIAKLIRDRRRKCRSLTKQDFLFTIFVIYCYLMISETILSRSPHSRITYNLFVVGNMLKNQLEVKYTIENVMMFIPIGIMIPSVFMIGRRLYITLLCSFLFSFSIEVVQLITERGFFQLNDMILNTVGGVIGYTLCRIILVYKKIKTTKRCSEHAY